MADVITVDQRDELAAQLPPQEQLKLVARISGRLCTTAQVSPKQGREEERDRKERLRLAEQLLAEVEDVEDDSQGEFDSAETIRQIRDERIAQICRRDA